MSFFLKITVEPRFFVCVNGVPMGSAFDVFALGELRCPFPFRRQGNYFKEEAEALTFAERAREHFAEIEALPENKKPMGSAQLWRLAK